MTLPRRKPAKTGLSVGPQIRSAGHLSFVRGFVCAASLKAPDECQGKIEAAHVRTGTDGGMGVKPGDNWAIPLCSEHHRIQHQIGERAFEARYGINMKSEAEKLWKVSRHRLKFPTNPGTSRR